MKRATMLVLGLLAGAPLLRAGTPPLPVINTNLIFDVTNSVFAGGAFGDGVSNSAAAINAAINTATTNVVGGVRGATIRIPANGTLSTFLSGPITLKDNVSLLIDAGATLKMLPYANWPGTTTFITGSSIRNLAIRGTGTLDGNAGFSTGGVTNNWWQPCGSSSCQIPRPNFIDLSGCSTVLIENVTMQNPPTFHIMAKGNNVGLTFRNFTINTDPNSPNTDGMDLGSSNVLIYGCSISDGDDNIEIGGSSAGALDITITNCTFGFGHGVSMGSLVNGSGRGVQDLIVSNCTFTGTDYGIRMKSDRDRGGICQNLQYMDLTMTNVLYPIVIYSYYNSVGTPNGITPFRASTDTVQTVTTKTPIWRNITISNVTATALGGTSINGIMWGVPEMLVSNVTLAKVNFIAPTKTFCIYNATGIRIVDSNLTAPNTTTNTLTLYNADITITNTAANTNLITLGGLAVPPTNNTLAFFNSRASITDTNMLGAAPITLGGSTLSFQQSAVTFSNNLVTVSASRLILSNGNNTVGGALNGSGRLTVSLTNSAGLRFDQGTNTWGGTNTLFDAGTNGTIFNHATNNITIFLGALTGGSTARLRGSDLAGAGVDTYVIGGLNSNTTFAGTISNGTHTVALTKIGGGTFTLTGTNVFTGGTTVSNGTLLVNGSMTGTVTVVSSATLGGTGLLRGPVTVNGTLAPGSSAGTLAISNSLIASGILQYELGTISDLTVVRSNLTLSGTLNVTDAGGFTNNSYTLLTYGGTLTYNGVNIGSGPAGYSYLIDTGTVGQVKLAVLTIFEGWQLQYFGCTNCPQATGNADSDGDGQSNTNEFLAGTNPTNSASALQIISESPQGNSVVITWTTAGGRTNTVQFSPGDSGNYTTNFTDLSSPIIISGSGGVTTNYVDTDGATNLPARYYRVRLVP
jgi:polygalacturonase